MARQKAKWPKLPRFFVPLFECANIYLCTTHDEYAQALAALGVVPEDTRSLGGCVRRFENTTSGELLLIIGVFTGQLHVLAHECAHATFRVCEFSGVEIDPHGTNETFCYLLDKIFKEFEPHIKKPAVSEPV